MDDFGGTPILGNLQISANQRVWVLGTAQRIIKKTTISSVPSGKLT